MWWIDSELRARADYLRREIAQKRASRLFSLVDGWNNNEFLDIWKPILDETSEQVLGVILKPDNKKTELPTQQEFIPEVDWSWNRIDLSLPYNVVAKASNAIDLLLDDDFELVWVVEKLEEWWVLEVEINGFEHFIEY